MRILIPNRLLLSFLDRMKNVLCEKSEQIQKIDENMLK